MDLQDGVLIVLLAGEQHDELGILQQGIQGILLVVQGLECLLAAVLRGQFQPGQHIVMGGFQAVQPFHFIFQLAFLPQEGGQSFRLVPGSGTGKLLLDGGKSFLIGSDVKDAPRGCRNAG